MQSIKHKWLVPFVYFEWKCEQLSELLKRWAFLNILGHVGRFGILVSFVLGAYYYVTEADQRRMEAENERKAKHCQAWQVINAARGRDHERLENAYSLAAASKKALISGTFSTSCLRASAMDVIA